MPVQLRFKNLLMLFFPIFVTLLLPASLFFIQKLFFARLQPGVMEAALNVIYALRIFQMPCVLLAMMAQVSVAQLYGAQEWRSIGNTLWQFIWFAILSNLIVIPFSLLYWKLYFQGTLMESMAAPYYALLVGINWLLPLGSALSCFYLGRGYTRVVVLGKIGAELLSVAIAYVLIFGNRWIPSLGLLGGAIATGMSQLLYCGLLLTLFFQKRYAMTYDSRNYAFHLKLFWHSIRPGVVRALGNLSTLACWAAVWHLMLMKTGEIDLRLITIGGTLFLLLSCLGDALCQSLTITISQIVGAQKYELFGKAARHGASLAAFLALLMGIPLLLFPNFILHRLFSFILLDSYAVYSMMIGVWLCLSLSMFSSFLLGYILAFKDTQIILLLGILCWIAGFLWTYLAFYLLHVPSIHFWSVTSITFLFNCLSYAWRVKKLVVQRNQELGSIP